MTKIDRYVLVLFLRTSLVCFLSISGIFIVFHAFSSLDEVLSGGEESVFWAVLGFYGPYLLLLLDMTGTIITFMAFLFTAGWLRRSGELTATLAAGVSHGRILRPMVVASLLIVSFQLVNREVILPRFQTALAVGSKSQRNLERQTIAPTFDRSLGILFDGAYLDATVGTIHNPHFHLQSDYGGWGDAIQAKTAIWTPKTAAMPAGYRITGVTQPEHYADLPSGRLAGGDDRTVILKPADAAWLAPGEIYLRTTVAPPLLTASESAAKLASVAQLATRVRNPAVHSSLGLHVMLHERVVRVALDLALILMVLPGVINERGRPLFTVIGRSLGLILGFFALKTAAAALGTASMGVSPAMAAWLPLLLIGPPAYARWQHAQTV